MTHPMAHNNLIGKLPLVHNKKFKRSPYKELVKAAHRYGFTQVGQGYIYSKDGPRSQILRKKHHADTAGGTEVPVTDVQTDLEYTVAVTIGTPGVTMALDFDTGSSDTWIWSTEYKASQSSAAQHAVYDSTKSSTSKKVSGSTWKISYGDGSMASGDVYTDNVAIGSITIPGQSIELAKSLSASFVSGGSDGLLGLAWPAINTVTPTPVATPVENMIKENLIASPLFTVKLTKGGANGFYTFGEIDTTVTSSPIKYTPVDNSQGFWTFASESWTLNGHTVQNSGGTAIADTGTTLMLLDDATVQQIYAAIPGAFLDSTQGGYVFPVGANLPALTFAVGNIQYTLNSQDMAYGDPDSNNNVFGGIQSAGNLGFAIFGDIFLKSVYVVFDQGNTRIGMAQRTD